MEKELNNIEGTLGDLNSERSQLLVDQGSLELEAKVIHISIANTKEVLLLKSEIAPHI